MLDRLVFTKEMWSAAIGGRPAPPRARETSLDGLEARLAEAGPRLAELVRGIDERGAWDTVFVDATCEPPASFTFGGVLSHVLTRDSHRRQVLIGVLNERGIETPGLVDALHFGGS